jgi:hypothetical protein
MTVRYRWSCQIIYERYTEFMDIQRQKSEVSKAQGWVPYRFWEATAGRLNDFYLEREYENLADLASELESRESDYEFMRLMRASYPMVVQGSVTIEIFESVDLSQNH